MLKEILKNAINEDYDIDEQGIFYFGNLFNLSIKKEPLMKLSIIGQKTINIPSFDELSKEYKEEDEEKLRKIYSDKMKKVGNKIIKLSEKFDKDLQKLIKELESEINKL